MAALMPWACLFSEKGVAMEQRVVKVSLETEDSPVSWLSSSSRGQKGFPGPGAEHQASLPRGDAATFLPQQEAQEIQHHGTRAWNGNGGEPGEGEAQGQPKNLSSYPDVNFWAKSRTETNSPSAVLER